MTTPDPRPIQPAAGAHPPSPRALREQALRAERAARPRAKPAATAPYLLRHWRGELHLLVALVASGALVWLAVQGIELVARWLPMTEHPLLGASLWLAEIAVLVTGALWWGVGVVRAALGHAAAGGSALVSLAAALTGLGAFAWVGLFWWLSARHVGPDVWAVLSGTAPPAAVRREAGGTQAVVEGDLEFGSMRALRAVLDASPAVRTVRLESRGGRVAEGLALGRLIAARNLDTLVRGECSSACVTAFAGGRQRLIAPTAKLGLHSAGGAGSNAESVARANQTSDAFMAARGVDLRVLEKGSAVANRDIWFPEPMVLLASNLATDYAPATATR
jgi:hypothetical protein